MRSIKHIFFLIVFVFLLCGCGKDTKNVYTKVTETAKEYLEFGGYSYSGLKEAIINYGYSQEEAQYAVDHCGANWNLEAVDVANEYTNQDAIIALYSSHDIVQMFAATYPNLIRYLVECGFTEEQARYGADHCDADWNAIANIYAKYHLNGKGISKLTLVSNMDAEGYTETEITYALEQCEADWMQQAAVCAAYLYDKFHHNYEELCHELRTRGFTKDEAIYGAVFYHEVKLPQHEKSNEEAKECITVDCKYKYFPEYPLIPKPDSVLDILQRSEVKTFDNDILTAYTYTYFSPIPGGLDIKEALKQYLQELDRLGFSVVEQESAFDRTEYRIMVGVETFMTVSLQHISDYDYFSLDMVPEKASNNME